MPVSSLLQALPSGHAGGLAGKPGAEQEPAEPAEAGRSWLEGVLPLDHKEQPLPPEVPQENQGCSFLLHAVSRPVPSSPGGVSSASSLHRPPS